MPPAHTLSWGAASGPCVGSWPAKGPVTEQVTQLLRSPLSSEWEGRGCATPLCVREGPQVGSTEPMTRSVLCWVPPEGRTQPLPRGGHRLPKAGAR